MARWIGVTLAGSLLAVGLAAKASAGSLGLPSPVRLSTNTFVAFIADNSRHGAHRDGCNGVMSLIPFSTGLSLFTPDCGGLNYETVFVSRWPPVGRPRPPAMEPREAPMHIVEADERHVVLVQPETAHSNVSARITFAVEEPDRLHQSIELTVHRLPADHELEPVTLSSLFASYIYRPRDTHVYLKARLDSGPHEDWVGITKRRHSSPELEVRPLPTAPDLSVAEHLGAMTREDSLSSDDQRRRGWPADRLPRNPEGAVDFYYGFAHDNQMMLFMFRQGPGFRFAYSPTGGGPGPTPSPAWDYALVVDRVGEGQVYRWDLCLVVKPFAGRADVLAEVARYRRQPVLLAVE